MQVLLDRRQVADAERLLERAWIVPGPPSRASPGSRERSATTKADHSPSGSPTRAAIGVAPGAGRRLGRSQHARRPRSRRGRPPPAWGGTTSRSATGWRGDRLDRPGRGLPASVKVTRSAAPRASLTPGQAAELGRGRRAGELDRHPARRLAEQVGDALDRDQPSVADDPDPVADPLDLVELVRGEEHGAAALAFLARRGRGTPPASAGRGRWSARRGSAAPGSWNSARIRPIFWRLPRESCPSGRSMSARNRSRQRLGAAETGDPAKPREQRDGLAPGGVLPVPEVAGQVAEPGADRDAVATAVEAEDASAARASGAAGRAASGSSSSCRRRWGRGSRTPRPRSTASVTSSMPAVTAVVLREPVGLDRRHGARVRSRARASS